MRKRIIIATLITVLGLTLNGCGGSSSSPPPPQVVIEAPENLAKGDAIKVRNSSVSYSVIEFTPTSATRLADGGSYFRRSGIGTTVDNTGFVNVLMDDRNSTGTYQYIRHRDNKRLATLVLFDEIPSRGSVDYVITTFNIIFKSPRSGVTTGSRSSGRNAPLATIITTKSFSLSDQLCDVGDTIAANERCVYVGDNAHRDVTTFSVYSGSIQLSGESTGTENNSVFSSSLPTIVHPTNSTPHFSAKFSGSSATITAIP